MEESYNRKHYFEKMMINQFKCSSIYTQFARYDVYNIFLKK